jgi:hypothetical protein
LNSRGESNPLLPKCPKCGNTLDYYGCPSCLLTRFEIGNIVELRFTFSQVGQAGMFGVVEKAVPRPSGDFGYSVLWDNGVRSTDIHSSNLRPIGMRGDPDITEALKKWRKYYDNLD